MCCRLLNALPANRITATALDAFLKVWERGQARCQSWCELL